MDAIDRQERYLKGLAAKDIKVRYLVHMLMGLELHQFIIGTIDGVVMYAPHHLRPMIGTDLEELDEWGRLDLLERI